MSTERTIPRSTMLWRRFVATRRWSLAISRSALARLVNGLTFSTTLSRAVRAAPTGIRTTRSAWRAKAWRPVASALARVLAVFAALLAVVRALERVLFALLRAVLRLRVAAAFFAEARRCVWVWVAMWLAILPGVLVWGQI